MGAIAAGDVGIDGEIVPRLQGQGTVRTTVPVNRGTHRNVSQRLQGNVRVNRFKCCGCYVVGRRTVVVKVDNVIVDRGIIGSISVGDNDVKGVQEQFSNQAVGRCQIDRVRGELQMLLARYLGKAAVARKTATAGGDVPEKTRHPVRPDNHSAAVTASERIGLNRHLATDRREVGIALRTAPLEVAPDQYLAPADVSGYINIRLPDKADFGAQYPDLTTRVSTLATRCVQRAGHSDDALARTLQHDLTIAFRRRTGLNNTLHVDGIINDIFRRTRGHQHHFPTVGEDLAAVVDKCCQLGTVRRKQTLGNTIVDPDLNQSVAIEIKRERIA